MKVQLEIDKALKEPEIIIRSNGMDKKMELIQKMILNMKSDVSMISFYKDEKEFYFPIEEILFFETEGNAVYGHTKEDVYKVKFKLYELENLLPDFFLRVSKSTILNVQQIFSIDKNITSYSLVQFYKSHKQVYVSRSYYKSLKCKLEERRIL